VAHNPLLGLKRASIKLLLFRARRRLAGLLRDPRQPRPSAEHQPSRSED
jgi:hypothetical protein